MTAEQLKAFLKNLLTCPVKKTFFANPVTAKCGHSVDYSIVSQLNKCPTCKSDKLEFKPNKILQRILELDSVQNVLVADEKNDWETDFIQIICGQLLFILSDPLSGQPFIRPVMCWENGIVFEESIIKEFSELSESSGLKPTFYRVFNLETDQLSSVQDKISLQPQSEVDRNTLMLLIIILSNNYDACIKITNLNQLLLKPVLTTGETILHLAALLPDTKILLFLLTQLGAEIYNYLLKQDRWGYTPLMYAVLSNNLPAVPLLCGNVKSTEAKEQDEDDQQENPIINAVNSYSGQTALHLAAKCIEYNNNSAMIESLLENKANADLCDRQKRTALFVACEFGNLYAVDILSEGLDVNFIKDRNGNTLLHIAILHGRVELITFFVKLREGNLLLRNRQKITPLVMANEIDRQNSDNNHTLIKTLLDPLIPEVKFERRFYRDEIKALIDLRLMQNTLDKEKISLSNVEKKGIMIADIYRLYGYDKFIQLYNKQKEENLHNAYEIIGRLYGHILNNLKKINKEDIQRFIDYFKVYNYFTFITLDYKKMAALIWSIYSNSCINICRMIFGYIEKFDRLNNNIEKCAKILFSELIIHYLEPFADCGYTPIHFAACLGYVDGVKRLLEQKDDINAQTIEVLNNGIIPFRQGETALHIAFTWNDHEMIKYLVQAGADVTLKDGDNKSPLTMAFEKPNVDLRILTALLPIEVANIKLDQIKPQTLSNSSKKMLWTIRHNLNNFYQNSIYYEYLPFFYIAFYYGKNSLDLICNKKKDIDKSLLPLKTICTINPTIIMGYDEVCFFLKCLDDVVVEKIDNWNFINAFLVFIRLFILCTKTEIASSWEAFQAAWQRLNPNQKNEIRQAFSRPEAYRYIEGVTILHMAITKRFIPLIEFLITELRVDVNAKIFYPQTTPHLFVNQTALHIASTWAEPLIVELLMKSGADIKLKDVNGKTPLMSALSCHELSLPQVSVKTIIALLPIDVIYINLDEIKEDKITNVEILNLIKLRKLLNAYYQEPLSDNKSLLWAMELIFNYYNNGLEKFFEKMDKKINQSSYLQLLYLFENYSITNFQLFFILFKKVNVNAIEINSFAPHFFKFFFSLMSDMFFCDSILMLWECLNSHQQSQMRSYLCKYDLLDGQTLNDAIAKADNKAISFLINKLNIKKILDDKRWFANYKNLAYLPFGSPILSSENEAKSVTPDVVPAKSFLL